MSDRALEFRIGIFIIFASIGLIGLGIMFSGGLQLGAKQSYITVKFVNAPGVAVGVPVRKNGIRIGAVTKVEFDERTDRPKNEPEGVLITLGIEEPFKLTQESIPMIQRALIGDTLIEIMTGSKKNPEPIQLSADPEKAMIIQGQVSADPNEALALATNALNQAGKTLSSIEEAAIGVAALTKKAELLEDFINTWSKTGKNLGQLAERADKIVVENEADIKPSIAALKRILEGADQTFDADARSRIQAVIKRADSLTESLDKDVMAALKPLAADLGSDTKRTPVTNLGQALLRLNAMAAQLGLLTRTLSDSNGQLNTTGSLQKLLTDGSLYSETTATMRGANEIVKALRPAIKNMSVFAERVAADPGAISRGALKP
ncbi:MAG: MlaD family protein [Planctomycetota bacterium]|nr:MlaD family protein [Planctomycetota bacterium]